MKTVYTLLLWVAGMSSFACERTILTAEQKAGTDMDTAYDVDDIDGSLFGDADFRDGADPEPNQLQLLDRFNRYLNDYGVNLVDWQGYLANPYVALRIKGPENGQYPISVTIEATGTSRLMLNRPSTLSADGASKNLILSSASDVVPFMIEIHPDRGGENEVEHYQLVLRSTDTQGTVLEQSIPLRVLDQDEQDELPSLPIKIDTRYDNLSPQHFSNPDILATATQAIMDWFYFFDMEPFDDVPSGQESFSLAGDNWQNYEEVTNNEPYNGMWVFLRSFSGPYSAGYPADNGMHHTRDGKEAAGPLHRSVSYFLYIEEGATVFTSLDDELWYQSDIEAVVDIYTFLMQGFGQAIAFHQDWEGIYAYRESGGVNADEVIDYQGIAVPLNDSCFIPEGEMYWDRLSGQHVGWEHAFPLRRWMITKLSLLIAAQAGWELRRDLSPFVKTEILTTQLPAAYQGYGYRYTLWACGGVPFYDWQVVSGNLPQGFSLNRYTGTLEAEGDVQAPTGTYYFSVQLHDYDELSPPYEMPLQLIVR
ncbi:MAG: peptidase S8 [Deltaproteobacteria bacterium]|nr:peptidase S8 [Deltaproteobacteria bacterium]